MLPVVLTYCFVWLGAPDKPRKMPQAATGVALSILIVLAALLSSILTFVYPMLTWQSVNMETVVDFQAPCREVCMRVYWVGLWDICVFPYWA